MPNKTQTGAIVQRYEQ